MKIIVFFLLVGFSISSAEENPPKQTDQSGCPLLLIEGLLNGVTDTKKTVCNYINETEDSDPILLAEAAAEALRKLLVDNEQCNVEVTQTDEDEILKSDPVREILKSLGLSTCALQRVCNALNLKGLGKCVAKLKNDVNLKINLDTLCKGLINDGANYEEIERILTLNGCLGGNGNEEDCKGDNMGSSDPIAIKVTLKYITKAILKDKILKNCLIGTACNLVNLLGNGNPWLGGKNGK